MSCDDGHAASTRSAPKLLLGLKIATAAVFRDVRGGQVPGIGWFCVPPRQLVDRSRQGAFNSTVEGLLKVAFALALPALAVTALVLVRGDLTLSTWIFVLVIASVAVVAVFVGRFSRRGSRVHLIEVLEEELALGEHYARHLNDVLGTLQKVLQGAIPNVSFETFLEDGMLQPAREFLVQRPGEDVRLSVLVPSEGNWRMAFAAGYRLESKQRFSLPIALSFSRHAFETGKIQWSFDLPNDRRFTPHPQASRTYRSIISVPVRVGDDVVGVFNVDSTFPDAFPRADFTYIELLGSIIGVVCALLSAQPQAPAPHADGNP